MGGLNSTTFYAMFPEFSAAPLYLVQQYIDLINGYYRLTDVEDSLVLLNYNYLLAHFVALSTMPGDRSQVSGPSAVNTKSSETAGSLSASYVSGNIANMTADQSFLTSTRYGQVFYNFKKVVYLETVYGL